MGYKVNKETAELEFERFAVLNKIDTELEGDTEDDKKEYTSNKSKLVKAIMKGSLEVDDKGVLKYSPEWGENPAGLIFNRPTGATIRAFNTSNQDLNAALADVTKQPVSIFSRMDYADLKICYAVINLFLV